MNQIQLATWESCKQSEITEGYLGQSCMFVRLLICNLKVEAMLSDCCSIRKNWRFLLSYVARLTNNIENRKTIFRVSFVDILENISSLTDHYQLWLFWTRLRLELGIIKYIFLLQIHEYTQLVKSMEPPRYLHWANWTYNLKKI